MYNTNKELAVHTNDYTIDYIHSQMTIQLTIYTARVIELYEQQ